jgi:hypothetical protein
LFYAALLHEAVDLQHQLRLNQVLFGIPQPDSAEHIAARHFVVDNFLHTYSPSASVLGFSNAFRLA